MSEAGEDGGEEKEEDTETKDPPGPTGRGFERSPVAVVSEWEEENGRFPSLDRNIG